MTQVKIKDADYQKYHGAKVPSYGSKGGNLTNGKNSPVTIKKTNDAVGKLGGDQSKLYK